MKKNCALVILIGLLFATAFSVNGIIGKIKMGINNQGNIISGTSCPWPGPDRD